MNRVVLDASALLAILNQEPGAEKLTPELLSAAAISTVNLAEVHGKLVGRGLRPDDAWEAALRDRKSTRLNSSHANISYAVFCLKKKKKTRTAYTCHRRRR